MHIFIWAKKYLTLLLLIIQAENKPLFMQEEGALLKKHPMMELSTPPQGNIEELDSKLPAVDTVDSPHISPEPTGQKNDDKMGDTNDEVTPKTTSNISMDSSTLAEVLVSIILLHALYAQGIL